MNELTTRLLAILSPGEQIPLDLLKHFVRHEWRELDVKETYGPDNAVHVVPAWGPGVVTLTVAVANWGVDWDAAAPPDPAKTAWKGPGPRSGKHMLDGGSANPRGGLGLPHLDSGGLLQAYAQWGSPWRGLRVWERSRVADFNVILRSEAERGPFLTWADARLADPKFHAWLIGYWLRHYWTPSWEATRPHATDIPDHIARAVTNARIRNSASSWAKQWAHLPAKAQQTAYIDRKRETRGPAAQKRAERQVRYINRAIAAIEAARIAPVE